MKNLKPLSDFVLVKILDADEITPGGIYVPPTAQEKSQKGIVVAVGPGKVDNNGNIIPMTLIPYEKVLFVRHSGTEVSMESTIETKKHLIIREKDILAVIEE
jgi:chaperonin GroES